jgi:hypothetical protein
MSQISDLIALYKQTKDPALVGVVMVRLEEVVKVKIGPSWVKFLESQFPEVKQANFHADVSMKSLDEVKVAINFQDTSEPFFPRLVANIELYIPMEDFK